MLPCRDPVAMSLYKFAYVHNIMCQGMPWELSIPPDAVAFPSSQCLIKYLNIMV